MKQVLPEVEVTPAPFVDATNFIDPPTGNLIVKASGRFVLNGIQRKVACCMLVAAEALEDADDGLHDKTREELLRECEVAVTASVAAIDRRVSFVGMGESPIIKNSLESMGIVPPKLKEQAA